MDLVVVSAYRSGGIGHEALRMACPPLFVSGVIAIPYLRSHFPLPLPLPWYRNARTSFRNVCSFVK
jgi:hypothetical protein